MTSVTNEEIETIWPDATAQTTTPDDVGWEDSPVIDDAGMDDAPPQDAPPNDDPSADDAGRDDT